MRRGAPRRLLITGCSVIDGYAVKVQLVEPMLLDCFSNLLRRFLLVPIALRDRPAFLDAARTQRKPALVLGLLAPAGYVVVLYALTLAPLSCVAPAREVSMRVAALLGGHLLGDGDPHWRLAGAVCIALGVGGLAVGSTGQPVHGGGPLGTPPRGVVTNGCNLVARARGSPPTA